MATKKRKDLEPAGDLPSFSNGREFDALSAEEKEKVWNYYDRKIPLSETRPLNAAERATFNRVRRKAGRPRIGQGAKVVAVTLEKGLLKRVDAYAKRHDMKRAEMITKGLKIVMCEAQPAH
jgi:hypothetical protein